ncbi:glycerophosphodiester phosphodiesterase [Paenibacillus xerothermodurans]|uniref:Glycerophosphodiester phosphodiesterase n=1 Tax=Paenibacillus xerothermodurans TaxID=1977292 RepID=A0A2W1P593_PAEXE|nr:glycerophosphodiester phosphodiesterase family protein [Paenibacillus xerothermodurans]PZE22822.1 glycerophosphodiester phosphodiesterase [Paenibacillus xerothermodurans]
MSVRGVAHRGYPGKLPENTLSSFAVACKLNFSHLELDVHLSKDGVPVVIHDDTIDRTTNGRGRVKDYTAAELQRFVIAGNERIPTLEEALLLCKDRIRVNIELKQMGSLYPGLEEQVYQVIEQTAAVNDVIVSSFDHDAVIRMRALSSELALGLITFGGSPAFLSMAQEMNARYLSMHHGFIMDRYVDLCLQNDIQLIAWTVNQEEQMQEMLKYPSVLVCTDELEKWINTVAGTASAAAVN